MERIFGRSRDVLIGAIHFPPLPGYDGFPGFERAERDAVADAKAFQTAGFDAVIIENNYDLPHVERVSGEVAAAMETLGRAVARAVPLPIGVSVLWNDFRTAFRVAKAIGGKFIRVPVFVDVAQTAYGTISQNPAEVLAARREMGADSVAIFADVHVKHATILTGNTVTESARRAVDSGADALIVTGKWTGDAPDTADLASVRAAVGSFPIVCGSGVSASNARGLFAVADGAIVSTALKEGEIDVAHVNLASWEQRVSAAKAADFVAAVRRG